MSEYNPAEVERLIAEVRTFGSRDRQGLREAMADQLEAARDIIADLSPQDIQAIVDENDRMHKAFSEALLKLQTGASVHSGFCCWCRQHWPHLDGESFEALQKYTAEHAEVCPANKIRIERDAARATIENLEGMERATRELQLAGSRDLLRMEGELEAARAEADRMRTVVEAAVTLREAAAVDGNGSTASWLRALLDFEAAADTYRASKP